MDARQVSNSNAIVREPADAVNAMLQRKIDYRRLNGRGCYSARPFWAQGGVCATVQA